MAAAAGAFAYTVDANAVNAAATGDAAAPGTGTAAVVTAASAIASSHCIKQQRCLHGWCTCALLGACLSSCSGGYGIYILLRETLFSFRYVLFGDECSGLPAG